jgi:HSP20 family protein
MALTRWDPFHELTNLQDRMNRLFQEGWGAPLSRRGEESLGMGTFVPPVDVYEDEHSIVLKMEVPGIDQKDIDVRVENNVLTVHGERKFEKDEKQENFQRLERSYGSFTRSFTLPNSVDTDNVSADYENGVLKIRLAKRSEAKPKQIKVNIGQGKTIEAGKSGKAA